MRLSKLQKHILLTCMYEERKKINRKTFFDFYARRINGEKKNKRSAKNISDTVTRSLERLINKECLVGFGEKTPHRFYISSVRLTPEGRKRARALFGKQQKLFKR